jgi:hypothetical protein
MMNVTLVLLALLAQVGASQPDLDAKAKAQVFLKEGTELYQHGIIAEALEKFEQAYAIFPSPKLLFNIGQVNRELGRPIEAIAAFEKFQTLDIDANPELLGEAKRLTEELSKKVARLLIECAMTDAEIAVDGKVVGNAPIRDLVRVLPGQHQVTATHPGAYPAVETVVVSAAVVQPVVIWMRALAENPVVNVAPPAPVVPEVQAAKPVPQPQGWWLGRTWTWVAAGSTVVFAGVATTAGMLMQSKFDSLRHSCGEAAGANWTGCSAEDRSSLDTRKNVANVFWGLTAAAAVTTGVLFFIEGHEVAVAPMAGGSSGFYASVRY